LKATSLQLERYRFKNSILVRVSSLHHCSLCHRFCPTITLTMQKPKLMPKASRRCQWQRPNPAPLPAEQVGRGGGRCGAVNLAPAGPAPADSPKLAGRGKGKRTSMHYMYVLGERHVHVQWVAINGLSQAGFSSDKLNCAEQYRNQDGTMKDIPGQRKIPCTYHSLVLGYPTTGPGISDFGISFLVLGYPRPGTQAQPGLQVGSWRQLLDLHDH
jgi:hypothetical protein